VAVPTYRLETFGKLELSGGASGLSHQKRRLALLAILAASGERGISRDQLLGYLWPESSATNARHSLDQLLHAMRRTLGESIFSSTNPVRLDFGEVSSDVSEFERALADGALGDAVALYRGPFLQGFYLDDAAEFERWTSAERARLAERYVDASTKLAADAESASDYQAAVRWRRRLVEADPLSSRSALALMRALVAAGDVTAALQHARTYESLVQQELGSAPDPSIAKYAAMLRAGGEAAASVSGPGQSGQTTARSRVIQNNVADVTVGESKKLADTSSATPSESGPHVDDETVRQPLVVEQVTAGRPNYWWPVGMIWARWVSSLSQSSAIGGRDSPRRTRTELSSCRFAHQAPTHP
jgi:serine/threonine-protein kinase